VAKQKKKLKNSKKVNQHFCTNCCQWVEYSYPHSCYDAIRSLLVDVRFKLIKLEEAIIICRNFVNRSRAYKDFV